MKSKTRYLAALSAAAAIVAAISLAPAALAATGSASAPQPTPHVAVAADPTSPNPAKSPSPIAAILEHDDGYRLTTRAARNSGVRALPQRLQRAYDQLGRR
jgi:hypothetical protein